MDGQEISMVGQSGVDLHLGTSTSHPSHRCSPPFYLTTESTNTTMRGTAVCRQAVHSLRSGAARSSSSRIPLRFAQTAFVAVAIGGIVWTAPGWSPCVGGAAGP